jgi:hypothetical protein
MGDISSDGSSLDSEEKIRNWCFCGDEGGAGEQGKGTVLKQIKDGKAKAKAFDKNYANCEESTGADVNWRLRATAFGVCPELCRSMYVSKRRLLLTKRTLGPRLAGSNNEQYAVVIADWRGIPFPASLEVR